jgi:hypothetical protein
MKNELLNIPDINLVKNITLIFFNDLFKMLYSMPMTMRIICKILYKFLYQKYVNKKSCLHVIGDFIINYWLGSTLVFDTNLIETGKLNDYAKNNVE